jgi:APA family basic amino acid/polyamine antiporter
VRAISLVQATAMVVGTIIGASIFVQPAEIARGVPSIPAVLAAWILAGVLTLAGALICAELAARFPRTGGVYVYLSETLGPLAGFLWGWAMFWSVHSGIIAAIALVLARYVGYFAAIDERLVAIAAIVVLSAINYAGVRHGARLQTAFTIGKLLAILAILALAFTLGGRLPDHFVVATRADISVGDLVLAVAAGLFAFGGWHMVTYAAGETVDPRRTIPLALTIGTLVVTACYVALNVAYLYVLPLEAVMGSTRVAADAADVLVGRGGGAAMSGLVVFSTFGALSGIVLAGPRVYYSMALDGLAWPWLGHLHARFRTPSRAIVLQAVWACVLVATGSYRGLFMRVIYTEWIFFALMAAGLLLVRRRAGRREAAIVPGIELLSLLFIAACIVIVVRQLAAAPADSAFGLGVILMGWPACLIWRRARTRELAHAQRPR